MSEAVVRVKRIRAGQPRAYADSIYESELHFSNTWDSTTGPREGTWCPDEPTVKALVSLLVCRFVEGANQRGLDPYLKECVKTGPQSYRVVIVEPYCD